MRHIALFRGVNVGGAGKLAMSEFREMLTGMGFERVRTCIQSGNAIFDAADEPYQVAAKIVKGVEARFGFCPSVIMRRPEEMEQILRDQLFQDAPISALHIFCCSEDQMQVDRSAISALAADGEDWAILGRHFVLFAPAGIGKSKLAERLPKLLRGDVTTRNMRTVRAILDIALTNP
ncbi:DUF1697 domain-containing protein [Thioclava sp. FR2]|uniref:DUF1697 domain-containing protein n=1 Tax=Thioclava sp. FR2 TaxID=3445780 RepID=UPI003EBBD42A